MSTKIYNGYKIKAKNLDEVLSVIESARNSIVSAYNRHVLRKELIKKLGIILNHAAGIETGGAGDKLLYLEKDEIEETQYPDLCFYVFPRKIKDSYFCVLNIPGEIEKEVLSFIPQMEYNGYWNNSDQPEEISDQEWDERADSWAAAIPTGLYSTSGFKISFFTDYTIPQFTGAYREEIQDLLKNFTKQEFNQFINIATDKRATDLIIEHSAAHDPDFKTSIRYYMSINDKVREKKLTNDTEKQIYNNTQMLVTNAIIFEDLSFDFFLKTKEEFISEVNNRLNICMDKNQLESSIIISNKSKRLKI